MNILTIRQKSGNRNAKWFCYLIWGDLKLNTRIANAETLYFHTPIFGVDYDSLKKFLETNPFSLAKTNLR
jgi:hypothetical protein